MQKAFKAVNANDTTPRLYEQKRVRDQSCARERRHAGRWGG